MACSTVISDFEVLSADETGRRRDRSDAEKIRIVEESFRGHRQGSAKRLHAFLNRIAERQREEARVGGPSGKRLSGPTIDSVAVDPPEEG